MSIFYADDSLIPSQANFSLNGGWIWSYAPVSTGRVADATADKEIQQRIISEYKQRIKFKTVKSGALGSADLFNICKDAVKDLPCSRSGKWLLRYKPHEIDDIWFEIKALCERGDLGPAVKTGPIGDMFLICVYTSDFTDENDVLRVLTELIVLLLQQNKLCDTLSYKADCVTCAFSNEYGTSQIKNGTFYHGAWENDSVVFSHAKHMLDNSGRGAKVSVVENV